MARFDVYRRRDRDSGYLLDVQADLFSQIDTRIIVPLLPATQARRVAVRLNPVFEIVGRPYVMLTQFAAAMPVSDLGKRLTSLADEHTAIIAAFDLLITGV